MQMYAIPTVLATVPAPTPMKSGYATAFSHKGRQIVLFACTKQHLKAECQNLMPGLALDFGKVKKVAIVESSKISLIRL